MSSCHDTYQVYIIIRHGQSFLTFQNIHCRYEYIRSKTNNIFPWATREHTFCPVYTFINNNYTTACVVPGIQRGVSPRGSRRRESRQKTTTTTQQQQPQTKSNRPLSVYRSFTAVSYLVPGMKKKSQLPISRYRYDRRWENQIPGIQLLKSSHSAIIKRTSRIS